MQYKETSPLNHFQEINCPRLLQRPFICITYSFTMKLLAVLGFVLGVCFMLFGMSTATSSAIHQIFTSLWTIGGAQLVMLSGILWCTSKQVSLFKS